MCNNIPETEITFSMPDQLGTVLTIGNDSYEIHSSEGKLTDGFLDELLKLNNTKQFPQKFTLYDDNTYENPVTITFPDAEQMSVEYRGKEISYPVSFDSFFSVFTENVRKYAIYYAAPCNYRAFFFASFDDLVKKMERYRVGEQEVLKKL